MVGCGKGLYPGIHGSIGILGEPLLSYGNIVDVLK